MKYFDYFYPRSKEKCTEKEREIFYDEIQIRDANEIEKNETLSLYLEGITALCPRSGYPDFADFLIRVTKPKKIGSEYEFWKLFQRFRYVHISHEAITGLICKIVKEITEAETVTVVGIFSPRGNLFTRVVCTLSDVSEEERILQQFNKSEITNTSRRLSS